MIRWIITGITTSESHRSSSRVRRHPSGSNLRRSTMVEPSSIASARWAKPQVWNSGAAMCVRQPWRRGILLSRETAASTPASLRGAPLGVPVVPDVRITIRPCRVGASRSLSSWAVSTDSRVCASPMPSSSLSTQATTRFSTSAAASRSVNSSSWMTTTGFSRSSTSTSCGPANAVLR